MPASPNILTSSYYQWATAFTVDFVICQGCENVRCVVCKFRGRSVRRGRGEAPPSCPGWTCVDTFQNLALHAEVNLVEIRDHPQLGKGVFAKANIPINQLLGEYLGVLMPPNRRRDRTDPYQFTFDTFVIGKSPGDSRARRWARRGLTPPPPPEAKEYGNWTRFINHHCTPNVAVATGMYGQRQAVVFKALRNIAQNEEITIHYGRPYFTGMRMNCICNDQPAPHTPQGTGPDFPF